MGGALVGLPGGAELTAREREVFWLLADRLRNREIAERLHVGLRTVESHVSSILRKVGVDDRDEVAALAARLSDRGARGTPPPQVLSSLFGRHAEVAAVLRLVEEHRLVTLVGPPGVGKTRLALQVASEVVDLSPPLFVDLAVVGTEEDLVGAFAAALGMVEADGRLDVSLVDGLRAEPTWLIVDNCEHVEGAAAELLIRLFRTVPTLRVLATSRSPLGLDGERVFEVAPLDLPPEDGDPAALVDAPACQLFIERARMASTRDLSGSADQVADLCRRLDGLPLAIELAAAQARAFSIAELLDQLVHRFLDLSAERRDLPGRHRTLDAAVRWSYDLLDDDEQRLFSRCSVFPGAFELEALETTAGIAPIDQSDVTRLLGRLVDRSLVVASGGPDLGTTYRMLDSIRTFARARLVDAGEREVMARRHAQYHMERAVTVSEDLTTRRQEITLQWFDRRWTDVEASMRWALTHGEDDRAWQFLTGVGRRWLIIGPRGAVVAWIERLLARPLPAGELGLSARLTAAHLLCFKDTELALELAWEAQSLAPPADRAVHAAADLTAGKALAFTGRRDEATAHLERAVEAFRALGDAWDEALALQALGHVGGDLGAALTSYRRGANRFRDLNDDVMLANTLTLMTTRALTVDPGIPDIERWLAESRVLAERTGSRWERAHVDLNAADLGQHRGENDRAAATYRELLAVFERIGDRRCASRCLLGLGRAALARGEDDDAAFKLRRSATLAERVTYPLGVAIALRLLAEIESRAGDDVQAARLLGRADAAAALLDGSRRASLPAVVDLEHQLETQLGPDAAEARAAGHSASPEFPW